MSIIGYYDGTAIRVKEPLPMNQKVIVIPVENEIDWEESAAGVLHRYANTSLKKRLEKGGGRKAWKGINVYWMPMLF